MAFLILSAGMLTDLASAMMVRRRGFMLGSPPPFRAATVSSLMMRVKTLPRLASAAPFLCLMVCHLEWPDIEKAPELSTTNVMDSRVYCLAPGVPSVPFQCGVRGAGVRMLVRGAECGVHSALRTNRAFSSPK